MHLRKSDNILYFYTLDQLFVMLSMYHAGRNMF